MAILGAEFLKAHGRDKQGNWYFSMTRDGKPLIQPYNIFSDCFAAMAFGRLYQATGDKSYAKIAVDTFHNILNRKENPKGEYSKSFPGTRPLEGFALPMILCNLVLEIEHLLDPVLVEETIQKGIDTIMNKFYRPEYGLILGEILPEI